MSCVSSRTLVTAWAWTGGREEPQEGHGSHGMKCLVSAGVRKLHCSYEVVGGRDWVSCHCGHTGFYECRSSVTGGAPSARSSLGSPGPYFRSLNTAGLCPFTQTNLGIIVLFPLDSNAKMCPAPQRCQTSNGRGFRVCRLCPCVQGAVDEPVRCGGGCLPELRKARPWREGLAEHALPTFPPFPQIPTFSGLHTVSSKTLLTSILAFNGPHYYQIFPCRKWTCFFRSLSSFFPVLSSFRKVGDKSLITASNVTDGHKSPQLSLFQSKECLHLMLLQRSSFPSSVS